MNVHTHSAMAVNPVQSPDFSGVWNWAGERTGAGAAKAVPRHVLAVERCCVDDPKPIRILFKAYSCEFEALPWR